MPQFMLEVHDENGNVIMRVYANDYLSLQVEIARLRNNYSSNVIHVFAHILEIA